MTDDQEFIGPFGHLQDFTFPLSDLENSENGLNQLMADSDLQFHRVSITKDKLKWREAEAGEHVAKFENKR